jgi:hypothetical protein
MTTGTMSALEGDGSSLGGIVQANWYYFFHQKAEGVDVFDSPIYFALPASGLLSATDGSDTFYAAGDITAQGSLEATETGEDSLSASGVAFLSGELSATETGSDEFLSEAIAFIDGLLEAYETGSDSMLSSGDVPVEGALSASESSDTFSASGLKPKPISIPQGGRQRQDLEWQPWPLLADEVIRRAKRKRNEMLLLLH